MSKAIIIIDMWDQRHPGFERHTRLIEQLSLRLKKLMGRTYIQNIVVTSYDTPNKNPNYDAPWGDTNKTILLALEQLEQNDKIDSLVSWDKDEVMKFLTSRGVTDLYFAGVSFPGCIQGRPLGIDNMKNDFNCYLIADCVLDTLGNGYTEYDIIHDTYKEVFRSGIPYVHSEKL